MYLAVLSAYRVSHMTTSGIKYSYGPVGAQLQQFQPSGDIRLEFTNWTHNLIRPSTKGARFRV